MTDLDKKNVKLGIKLGIDWVALSFVQTANDIGNLRKISKNMSIMAKIEKPSALNHIEKITELADGLMIAREGILESTSNPRCSWMAKKDNKEARIQGKPVVVSTQMLRSMIGSKTPTRLKFLMLQLQFLKEVLRCCYAIS